MVSDEDDVPSVGCFLGFTVDAGEAICKHIVESDVVFEDEIVFVVFEAFLPDFVVAADTSEDTGAFHLGRRTGSDHLDVRLDLLRILTVDCFESAVVFEADAFGFLFEFDPSVWSSVEIYNNLIHIGDMQDIM